MSTPRAMRPSNSPMHLGSANSEVHRKASLNALTGANSPSIAASSRTASAMSNTMDVAIGDLVNVPGDMYGQVKFVGAVRGKQGRFIGVELAEEFAARGKNDGDVDGIRYFDTTIPGSGIFLPIHRAEKRSPSSNGRAAYPGTPSTPGHNAFDAYTPSKPNFSQSVGPGARAPSPQIKLKSRRPSLPRPESPFRKQPPTLAPTPARNFSMSQRGPAAAPPRLTASPAPSRAVTPRAVSTRTPAPVRPYSRNNSRLGHRVESSRPSTSSVAPAARRSPSRAPQGDQDAEVQRLLAQLEEKDRQLHDQTSTLNEMETSLKEIQDLMPYDGDGSQDMYELRNALHEKEDKIQSLISEFDAHRADFRSTIDTLELASAETERVYEGKIADLLAEIHELRELGHSQEDVENVARQLKGLEELVAELEEGLEDARRGEAEARGEVEFLRGEVERGRSELRREREKAAKVLQGAKDAEGLGIRDKDAEMKDDEIRGLKAVIHSLSSGAEPRQSPAPSRFAEPEELKRTQATVQQLEREKMELQGLIDRKAFREEELERAVEQLRRAAEQERNSIMNTNIPEEETSRRNYSRSPEITRSPIHHRSLQEEEEAHSVSDSNYEEDVNHGEDVDPEEDELSRRLRDLDVTMPGKGRYSDKLESPAPLALKKTVSHNSATENVAAPVAEVDNDKWCALCEKDGHLAFDCPDEQY